MAFILVIDDDGFYRGLMERALTDEGHHVVAAQNGVEGIASYQRRRPDLVITDMRMPGIGGGEVIRTLRRLNSKVRIIAVSGEANFYDIDLFKLAKEAGADAILRKLDPLERVVIEANTLLSRAA
jgi:CheY-like chemotaxis protein